MPQHGSYQCPPLAGRTTRRYRKEKSDVNAEIGLFGAWAREGNQERIPGTRGQPTEQCPHHAG